MMQINSSNPYQISVKNQIRSEKAHFTGSSLIQPPPKKTNFSSEEVETLWEKICFQDHSNPQSFIQALRNEIAPIHVIDTAKPSIFKRLIHYFFPEEHLSRIPFTKTPLLILHSNRKPFDEYRSDLAKSIAYILFSQQQPVEAFLTTEKLDTIRSSHPYSQLISRVFKPIHENFQFQAHKTIEPELLGTLKDLFISLDPQIIKGIQQCVAFEHKALNWITKHATTLKIAQKQQSVDSYLFKCHQVFYRLVNTAAREVLK